MIKMINGSCLRSMIDHGIKNLNKHRSTVNELNVFPVPDGDTGTNMVMTMRNGLPSIESASEEDVSQVARSFANGTVFGARGNSGVIISQFFKGVSEGLKGVREADVEKLSQALDRGCEFAYASVAKPVEGTVLTVLREASDGLRKRLPALDSVDEGISVFLDEAKASLKKTPDLLPILKKAGVVDSGGSGVVYFFEGVRKYLNGESIDDTADTESESDVQATDYSVFNKNSVFEYGYCTELLIQLIRGKAELNHESLLLELGEIGDSIVSSVEDGKVKLHIHTQFPERVLEKCHIYGEFLSVKIENMSVQHTQSTRKILCADNGENGGSFAVVAVAPNPLLQSMLSEMGADAVILSREAPSSQEFIEAFKLLCAPEILVFPNSSNSILSAMQAGSLYKNAKITVLNCRSVAECYSALAGIDFESDDINAVVSEINDTVGNIYSVSVVHAEKNIVYGDKSVVKNDYFALDGEDILTAGHKLETVALETVDTVVAKKNADVITLFYGENVSEDAAVALSELIEKRLSDTEVCVISTLDPIYDLIISFE